MEKFTRLTAIAAPLLRINVDTDAIIPSREMKKVGKTGLAGGLFAGWRYLAPGSRTEAAPRPCDTGFAHLSFLVDDVAAIARAASAFGFAATPDMPCIAAGPHAGRYARGVGRATR